jgi:mRNA interferase MazF
MPKKPYVQGSLFYCNLDPTVGKEIKKCRPCLIISPDELNDFLETFIIIPITNGMHNYQFRIPITHEKIKGCAIVDQIRTVDKERLINHQGYLSNEQLGHILDILQEMFAYQK